MELAIKNSIKRPVMRYHGGKFRLADWIMSFFPDHHHTYVEPFGGAASVLMCKPRSPAEVYNDLDADVVNVFRVLRDPSDAQRLRELCTLTPYARAEFIAAYDDGSDDPVEQARRTIFRAAAGFGSAGATKGRTGFRSYSRSDRSVTPAMDWASYPQAIQGFCERLFGVIIESGAALDVMARHDATDTLFYVDPPYLHATRMMDGSRAYRHEMSDQEHENLCNRLTDIQGFVVLSGYPNPMYDDVLLRYGWQRFTQQSSISGYRGTTNRKECVWLNPRCIEQARQQSLFDNKVAK